MIDCSTDAQPECLVLWDDYLRCNLLIVKHCTVHKLQLAYVLSLYLVDPIRLIVLHRKGLYKLVKELINSTLPDSRCRLPFNPSVG